MQACQTPGHMLEGESTEWKEKAIECGLSENVHIQGWADEEEPTEETDEVPPFISLVHSLGQQIFIGHLPWAGPGHQGDGGRSMVPPNGGPDYENAHCKNLENRI